MEEILAEKAAKDAKRALLLTMLAVMVAVAVLAIDNGIKRAIVTEAQKAQDLVNQVKSIAEEVKGGTPAAGETGTDSGDPVNSSNGVVHDPPAGKVLGEAERAPGTAPHKRPARAPRGSAGNG